MAVKDTYNKAPKVKIVPGTTTDAVAAGDAVEGELYYHVGTSGLQLKTSEGWATFSED